MQTGHVFDNIIGKASKMVGKWLDSYKRLFEITYRVTPDKRQAEVLLNKILKEMFE